MARHKFLASVAVSSGLLLLAPGGADARIVCEGNFQIVNGLPVSTPYCRERVLADVARSYGWRVTDQEVRYSESTKAQVCRAIGFDNRVREVCAPYQPDGGNGRFRF